MRLPEYVMDMRGSGIYCEDREVTLENPCKACGSLDGTEFIDDWRNVSLSCNECGAEQPLPEPDEPDWSRELEWDREDARDAWDDLPDER